MELMEDEDILEVGIRDKLQPPGKNSKYDAIFRRRKSVDGNFFIICDPEFKTVAVCLLDEIEAALMIITTWLAQYLHKSTKIRSLS